jgi:hypothetical protein
MKTGALPVFYFYAIISVDVNINKNRPLLR